MKEWTYTENINDFISKYEISIATSDVLSLLSYECTIFYYCLVVIMKNRKVRNHRHFMRRGTKWRYNNFRQILPLRCVNWLLRRWFLLFFCLEAYIRLEGDELYG